MPVINYRTLLSCGATSLLLTISPAFAQSNKGNGGGTNVIVQPPPGDCTAADAQPAPIPPEKFAQSPGGVDMRSGRYLYSHADLSAGSDRMQLIRESNNDFGRMAASRFGGLTHNWEIYVNEKRVKTCTASSPDQYDYVVSVSYGGKSTTFRSDWPPQDDSFVQISYNEYFAKLAFDYETISGYVRPKQYTFYAYDGSKVVFRPTGLNSTGGDGCGGVKCAYASQIVEPSGVTYDLSYDVVTAPAAGTRLRSVVDNRGHALLFEYAPVGANGNWAITKTCLLNLATMAMPNMASETVCPSGAPTSTYQYTSGKLSSFVDQTAVSSLIGPLASQVYSPGASTPYLTNTFANDIYGMPYVTGQSFVDGRAYSYAWDTVANSYGTIAGGSYTDNQSHTVTVFYGKYRSSTPNDPTNYVTPTPEKVTDELGQITSWYYCGTGATTCDLTPPRLMTMPDGDRYQLTYDGNRNVVEKRHIAKPGSALADVVQSSVFGCGAIACQTKPTAVTDPRGNMTNFTYSTVHGGVLTESDPADANGVHPVKRYTYVQRYAWIANGTGGYVHANGPIWLLATMKTCRTSATNISADSCAGGSADEVVTAYDYGPDTGLVGNNLWVRGTSITADGQTQRTCYGYDAGGNRIWETKPRAGLSACY